MSTVVVYHKDLMESCLCAAILLKWRAAQSAEDECVLHPIGLDEGLSTEFLDSIKGVSLVLIKPRFTNVDLQSIISIARETLVVSNLISTVRWLKENETKLPVALIGGAKEFLAKAMWGFLFPTDDVPYILPVIEAAYMEDVERNEDALIVKYALTMDQTTIDDYSRLLGIDSYMHPEFQGLLMRGDILRRARKAMVARIIAISTRRLLIERVAINVVNSNSVLAHDVADTMSVEHGIGGAYYDTEKHRFFIFSNLYRGHDKTMEKLRTAYAGRGDLRQLSFRVPREHILASI